MKKLNPLKVEEKLSNKNFQLFSPDNFRALFQVSASSASKFINHYCQKGLFIKLRNGLYVLKRNTPSAQVVANHLYQPSYISLETALSFYGIIPEKVYSYASITTKASREFMALGQSFVYHRLKKEAFQGYIMKDKFLIAEPEKALADYLYFVALKRTSLNERLDLARLNKTKVRKWTKVFAYPRLNQLIQELI